MSYRRDGVYWSAHGQLQHLVYVRVTVADQAEVTAALGLSQPIFISCGGVWFQRKVDALSLADAPVSCLRCLARQVYWDRAGRA